MLDRLRAIIKKKTILISSGAAILIATAFFFLYAPLVRELRLKYGECRSLERELADGRDVIEYAGKNIKLAALPDEKDVPLAIDELTRRGKSLGVNFIYIRPKDIISEELYRILPIEMETVSREEDFRKFTGSLDELKKIPVRLKSFEIVPDKEGPKTIKAKLTAYLFMAKESFSEAASSEIKKDLLSTKRRARRTKIVKMARSPFRPKGTPEQTGELTLSGIVWDKERPKAMIGSVIAGKGDKVGNYRVVDIKKDSVTLNDGTKDIILKLAE